jgi:tRNA pseudouridine55 synthase
MTANTQQPEAHDVVGVVNLYKPVGRSSAAYVYRLRGIFGIRKVGHGGTLDPFADGVLLACLGRATRLFDSLSGLPKHYRTTLRLGVTNATFDTERPFEPVPDAQPAARAAVEQAVARLVGRIEQVPPVFSAVKIRGRPSYALARSGCSVERPAKPVHVYRLEVLDYAWPLLRLDIACGRGTYIRAIARDLGAALGCGACCETLTRLAVGPFRTDDAMNLDTAPPEAVRAALIPLEEVARRLDESPPPP